MRTIGTIISFFVFALQGNSLFAETKEAGVVSGNGSMNIWLVLAVIVLGFLIVLSVLRTALKITANKFSDGDETQEKEIT